MEHAKTKTLILLCALSVVLVAVYAFINPHWTALTTLVLAVCSCSYSLKRVKPEPISLDVESDSNLSSSNQQFIGLSEPLIDYLDILSELT